MSKPHPKPLSVLFVCTANSARSQLAAAFAGPLAFGTAGLRAAVGAGESRMNRAVVIRTTYGLISWLKQHVDTPVVAIGCDARHGSAQFQRDAAQVISAAGGKALVLPAQNPTPLTAFTVRSLKADAGIMVTASHNPPADNGYKVYLGGRIATYFTASVEQRFYQRRQIVFMRALIDEQCLGRTANARAPHLGIDREGARHGEVGGGVGTGRRKHPVSLTLGCVAKTVD